MELLAGRKNFYTESGEEITHPEIAELKEPIGRILRQIWPFIIRQEYAVLLGDDYSGRIPTVILGQVINAINIQNDWSQVPMVFFKGRYNFYDISQSEKSLLLSNMQLVSELSQRKLLFVTDFISSGATIRSTGRILQESDIKYDVCAISIGHCDQPLPDLNFGTDVRVFDGKDVGVPSIYNKPKFWDNAIYDRELTRDVLNDSNTIAKSLIEMANSNIFHPGVAWMAK